MQIKFKKKYYIIQKINSNQIVNGGFLEFSIFKYDFSVWSFLKLWKNRKNSLRTKIVFKSLNIDLPMFMNKKKWSKCKNIR